MRTFHALYRALLPDKAHEYYVVCFFGYLRQRVARNVSQIFNTVEHGWQTMSA
jgi:hypothetical protein